MSLTAFFSPEIISQKKISRPFRTRPRCIIAGVAVNNLTMEEASSQIVDALLSRSTAAPFLIMGPNAQLITLAQTDARFFEALRASALNVPDGISVVLASKILGRKISGRVPGGELMERLCQDAASHKLSIFLLGGLPGAAAEAARRLQQRYPTLSIAGLYCPPNGFERDPMESAQIRQLITKAAPDLLFVAFGAPKQEIWMHENCLSLPIGAAMSVGAAFDTQSGMRLRAPRWTHKLGIEWLYRLAREPRRLWRRYLIGNTYFLYLVFRQLFLYGRLSESEQTLPTSPIGSTTHPLSSRPVHDPLPTESQI